MGHRPAGGADTLRGVVIRVIDGDTVWFKPDRHDAASRDFLKIRLVDIDAPEKNQPYGDAHPLRSITQTPEEYWRIIL